MIYEPGPQYRNVFASGMRGSDVAALQMNIGNLVVDGVFGKETYKRVRNYQSNNGLYVDGIAGGATQAMIITKRSADAQAKYNLPKKLLKSVAANESGLYVAAWSAHPNDSGFDLGAYQNSITPSQVGNNKLYELSLNVHYMAENTAAKIKTQHDKYVGKPYVTTDRKAWELAVLYHNRPRAADWYPTHGTYDPVDENQLITIYRDPDTGEPVIQYTIHDWCEIYIERATVYVEWG